MDDCVIWMIVQNDLMVVRMDDFMHEPQYLEIQKKLTIDDDIYY